MSTQDRAIIQQVERYRKALAVKEFDAEQRLIAAYRSMYGRLTDKIDLLAEQIEREGIKTRGQLARMQRYKALMEQIAKELADFGVIMRNEVEMIGGDALAAALADSAALMRTASGIRAGFDILSVEAVKSLIGFLDPEGPLYSRLAELAPLTVEAISKAIIDGVGLGYGPRKTAQAIADALGMGLTDAMRNVRTAQLWAYREATRANYLAHADIISGWVWWAELGSPRTCMSCVAMHGTVHPLDEVLDDHYNGRCAMIPIVEGVNPVQETGIEWFERQDETMQALLMGRGKYEAWADGQFQLQDMPGVYQSPVYGSMRVEKTLKELLGTQEN